MHYTSRKVTQNWRPSHGTYPSAAVAFARAQQEEVEQSFEGRMAEYGAAEAQANADADKVHSRQEMPEEWSEYRDSLLKKKFGPKPVRPENLPWPGEARADEVMRSCEDDCNCVHDVALHYALRKELPFFVVNVVVVGGGGVGKTTLGAFLANLPHTGTGKLRRVLAPDLPWPGGAMTVVTASLGFAFHLPASDNAGERIVFARFTDVPGQSELAGPKDGQRAAAKHREEQLGSANVVLLLVNGSSLEQAQEDVDYVEAEFAAELSAMLAQPEPPLLVAVGTALDRLVADSSMLKRAYRDRLAVDLMGLAARTRSRRVDALLELASARLGLSAVTDAGAPATQLALEPSHRLVGAKAVLTSICAAAYQPDRRSYLCDWGNDD